MAKKTDSPDYLRKKAQLRRLLTVYGRKPVLEALQDNKLTGFRLHLAESNKPAAILQEITGLAEARGIEIQYHQREALARISKNRKQDQGVCLDIHCPSHRDYQDFLQDKNPEQPWRLLALDAITNPQNLGMIIRSACAGNIQGILIPAKGCAKLDALVIKASAGTVFKAPILHCDNLQQALADLQNTGASLAALNSHATQLLTQFNEPERIIYILGNETDGIQAAIAEQCDHLLAIPMNNQVESLNVAVTAGLLAFRGCV